MKSRSAKNALASIAVSVLAACGGGGSDPTSAAAPIQVFVSEEEAAFNLLNAERDRCGFGLLAQNSQLDAAAYGHAFWSIANNVNGHFQTVGTPFFTGISPTDRVVAAGYIPNIVGAGVGEDISGLFGSNVKTGFGERSVRTLLNAPYHMSGLLGSYRDVGVSVLNDVDVGSPHGARVTAQFDLGYRQPHGNQPIGGAEVKSYPCAGSTGVERQLTNESPSPVPGRDLALNPLGTSVYIAVREGQTIAITSAALVATVGAVPVTLRTTVTLANDPQAIYRSHQAYFSADAPLDPNTQYTAHVVGTNDGVGFTQTFTFTTGI